MFIRIEQESAKVILQGLVLLLIIIIVGVFAAETQLNNLTKRSDIVQFLNVRRTLDAYSFYFFGTSFTVKAVKELGEISNTEDSVSIQVGNQKIVVPTIVYIDTSNTLQNIYESREFISKKMRQQKIFLSSYLSYMQQQLQLLVMKLKMWQQQQIEYFMSWIQQW